MTLYLTLVKIAGFANEDILKYLGIKNSGQRQSQFDIV
jgi:hypothetical protein